MALPRLTGSLAGRTGHPRWRGTYTGALHLSRPKAGGAGARTSACRHIRNRTQSSDIKWNSLEPAVTRRPKSCGWRSTPRSRSGARSLSRDSPAPAGPGLPARWPPPPRPAAHRVARRILDPRGPAASRRRRRLTPARSLRTPARACPAPFPGRFVFDCIRFPEAAFERGVFEEPRRARRARCGNR